MNVLVIGNGAREHAAVKKFRESPTAGKVYCSPGNAGSGLIAENVALDLDDHMEVISACRARDIGLVFIGPEGPLAGGLADSLRAVDIPTFGPGKRPAMLESSKAFARERSVAWGIPCAATANFAKGETAEFTRFLSGLEGKTVLKKSGLAAGKGVLESADKAALLAFGNDVLETDSLLAEEFLSGWELSVFALCDGKTSVLLPPCADHKKAGENGSGPNTGGMGAVCPVPGADRTLIAEIEKKIVAPAFAGMKADGLSYRGVLFFGVMVTAEGPKLLEYNVRFGDPETQSLFMLWEDDFLEVCARTARGNLEGFKPRFSEGAACGIVVAAPGYPGNYPKDICVASLPDDGPGIQTFHASTKRDASGAVLTEGGRCFTVVAKASTLADAQKIALASARKVKFEGAWFRRDIGAKFI